MDRPIEKLIEAASTTVEEARRRAHHDAGRIGALIESMSVLADLRMKDGDIRKAESLYREALSRVNEQRKPDGKLLAGIYSLIAQLNERSGRMDEAAKFYEKALQIGEQMGLNTSDETATIKNNLAIIFKGLRDKSKAETYYREALDIFRELHGENSGQVASVCNNLGVLYYANLDVERAQEMHARALSIREKLGEDEINPADLAQTYMNLAAVSKATGNFQKAQECLERAKGLRQASAGEDSPDPRRVAKLIIDVTA